MFAVQISLLGEKEDEFGEKLSLSWMESLYFAVQSTTTVRYLVQFGWQYFLFTLGASNFFIGLSFQVGYGDVTTPESLRWFLLLYLAISTYFVG